MRETLIVVLTLFGFFICEFPQLTLSLLQPLPAIAAVTGLPSRYHSFFQHMRNPGTTRLRRGRSSTPQIRVFSHPGKISSLSCDWTKKNSSGEESYRLFSKPPFSFFRQVSPQANLCYLMKEMSVISQLQRDSSLEYYFSRMQNHVKLNRERLLIFIQQRLLAHNQWELSIQHKAKIDYITAQDQHQRILDFLHSSLDAQAQEEQKKKRRSEMNRKERRMRRRNLFILSTWLEDVLPDPSQGKSWMVNMAIDTVKIAFRSTQFLLSLTKIVPKPKVFEELE